MSSPSCSSSAAPSSRIRFAAGGVAFFWTVALGATGGCFRPGPDIIDEPLPASTGAQTEPDGTTAEDDLDSSGDTQGDPDEDSGDDPPPLAEACESYCSLMEDHCESVPQYSGEVACQSVCERMNPGTPADALGNTVGCRTTHAFLAARSAEPHCHHAGPTGDGTCGATCESFCSLALSICTGELAPWDDADSCIADCQSWSPEPKYQADVPDDDTYACRMRHLTLAAAQPEVHCGHIGPVSPVCVAT